MTDSPQFDTSKPVARNKSIDVEHQFVAADGFSGTSGAHLRPQHFPVPVISPFMAASNAGSPYASLPPTHEATQVVGQHDKQRCFKLFACVVAIGEGVIAPFIDEKTRVLLSQVSTKVSKEQNTKLHFPQHGSLDVKLRVFVNTATEAKIVLDYIDANSSQRPAPFVLLCRKLHMGVMYDPSEVDVRSASAADRLRKQAKTRIIRLIRNAVQETDECLTPDIIKGLNGPLAAEQRVSRMLGHFKQPFQDDPATLAIVFSAKNRQQVGGESTVAGNGAGGNKGDIFDDSFESMHPWNPGSDLGDGQKLTPQIFGARHTQAMASAASAFAKQMEISNSHSLPGQAPHHTPSSQRSVNLHHDSGQLEQYLQAIDSGALAVFHVYLYACIIGNGEVDQDCPSRTKKRLLDARVKVPKEQKTVLNVCSPDGTDTEHIDVKLRVFVVKSEDGKLISEYVSSHPDQSPAPFVVLTRRLPMAVLFDPSSTDIGIPTVADRLRKQAKTRTVRLLREIISSSECTFSADDLLGQSGPTRCCDYIEEALAHRADFWQSQEDTKYICFLARNKPPSAEEMHANSSPKSVHKKRMFDAPQGQQPMHGMIPNLAMAPAFAPDGFSFSEPSSLPVGRVPLLSSGSVMSWDIPTSDQQFQGGMSSTDFDGMGLAPLPTSSAYGALKPSQQQMPHGSLPASLEDPFACPPTLTTATSSLSSSLLDPLSHDGMGNAMDTHTASTSGIGSAWSKRKRSDVTIQGNTVRVGEYTLTPGGLMAAENLLMLKPTKPQTASSMAPPPKRQKPRDNNTAPPAHAHAGLPEELPSSHLGAFPPSMRNSNTFMPDVSVAQFPENGALPDGDMGIDPSAISLRTQTNQSAQHDLEDGKDDFGRAGMSTLQDSPMLTEERGRHPGFDWQPQP